MKTANKTMRKLELITKKQQLNARQLCIYDSIGIHLVLLHI